MDSSFFPFLGSVIGGFQQSANIDKQIAANKAENRDTRLYNLNLAKMQNRWNLDQWRRENEYNSPSAVAARMKAAGLNPDLAYSQGGMFQPSATSPEFTSGAPATPADVSGVAGKKTYGQMFQEAVQIGLVQKQAENVGADTNKKKAETDNLKVENNILSADALVKAASAESIIEYNKAKVYVARNTADMLHNQSEYYAGMLNKVAAETDNLYKERDKIVAQTAELQENVVQMRFDRYLRSKEFELACRNLEQQIKESDSRIAVNYQDVKASVATTMATVLNLNADTRYKIQLRRNESLRELGIEINNDFASFNFDQAKKWSDKQNRAEVANKWMTGIGVALGGLSSAVKGVFSAAIPSPVKIAGFGRQ